MDHPLKWAGALPFCMSFRSCNPANARITLTILKCSELPCCNACRRLAPESGSLDEELQQPRH